MGKGEIISGGTDGLYSLKILMNRLRADNTISFLNTQITHLNDVIIPQLETEQADALTVLNAALTAFGTAITNYNAGTATRDELIAATRTKTEAESAYQMATFALKENQLKKDTYTKQVEYLESQTGEDPTVDAWCTDLTEDLSGIVGTIEIPGEWTNPIVIRPGYAGRSAYDSRRDGQLMPIMSMSPAQALYNSMMLPGWQKWMPTYRVGTIIERYIAGDSFVFDVTLDAAQSTAQGLNVNESDELYQVPAEYMETDTMAFEIGDRVIIEFIDQNYLRPKIIGFETNPRRCEAIFWVKVTRDDDEIITDEVEFAASFTVENSSEVEADYIIADFDSDPGSPTYGYWRIQAGWDPYPGIDADGYWLTVTCNDSVITQYPYRYKAADKKQAGDRIAPGIYDVAIPYWSVVEESTFIGYFLEYEEEHFKKLTIKSSIPYRIHHKLTANTITVQTFYSRFKDILEDLNFYTGPGDFDGSRWWPRHGDCWMISCLKVFNVHWGYDEDGNCCTYPGYEPPTWKHFWEAYCNYIENAKVNLKINGVLTDEAESYKDTMNEIDQYANFEPDLNPVIHSVSIQNISSEEETLVCSPGFSCDVGSHDAFFEVLIYIDPWTLEAEYDY